MQRQNGPVRSHPTARATLDALRTDEGRALVESLTPYDPRTAMRNVEAARSRPAWVDRPEVVAAAATQARLRTRARARFPGQPRWWTANGLEQATRPEVAARHARRFVEAGLTSVVDLGCGAGSDALALAAAGLQVCAVDRDADAIWALEATAADRGLAVQVSLGDVTALPGPWNSGSAQPSTSGCFVDPSRRSPQGRQLAPERWSPPWSWVVGLADRMPATGAKVAPGIDHAALPSGTQAEWVSVGGVLVEAGVWWGPLRRTSATRQATVLREPAADPASDDLAALLVDDRDGVPVASIGPVGDWLIEPDPAVIRAGLVSVLAERVRGHLLDPRIAYICARDEPRADIPGSAFAVLAEVPFGRRAMRGWLRARGYADVVVKKRGVNVVPEELRAQLRTGGQGPTATLVLTRTDAGPLALLVRRRGSATG